jgi:hypothetical protein
VNSRLNLTTHLLGHETPLRPTKIGQSAVPQRRVISPVFFAEPVNAESYHGILMNFIDLLEVHKEYSWFQQDGAT